MGPSGCAGGWSRPSAMGRSDFTVIRHRDSDSFELPMFDQIADESDLSPSSNLLLSGKVKELTAKPDVAANSGWFC
jgi:hypothetical protein